MFAVAVYLDLPSNQDEQMAMVMIKCPVKNIPVPTGMGMDKQTFDSMQMSGNTFKCPACGQMHTWSKGQAFLSG